MWGRGTCTLDQLNTVAAWDAISPRFCRAFFSFFDCFLGVGSFLEVADFEGFAIFAVFVLVLFFLPLFEGLVRRERLCNRDRGFASVRGSGCGSPTTPPSRRTSDRRRLALRRCNGMGREWVCSILWLLHGVRQRISRNWRRWHTVPCFLLS